jgi:sugar/nucleoside kinase (ribokinase family)
VIPGLEGFGSARLAELTARFGSLRVTVLGDFFLDKYYEVDPALAEPSLETGLTAHQVVGVRHSPGAAGTVVNNLAALGAGSLAAVGFTGDDGEGYELRQDLAALGVDLAHLHTDPSRRTPLYLKPRDAGRPGLAGEHSRYDVKNRAPTPRSVESAVLKSLRAVLPEADALIVMDQAEEEGRGTVTAAVVRALADLLPRFPRVVAWADSRRRIKTYRNLILKMNQFELSDVHDPQPGSEIPENRVIEALAEAEAEAGAGVYATVGGRGVWVGGGRPVRVPAVLVPPPVDPTGAGDSFSAGAVLALASGASPVEAALVGNLVASITVRQLSTTGTARPEELAGALELWKEQNP